jgi:hypothetical protein
MKIRQGFVSNSSSSSFVAICPLDIDRNDLTEMEDTLFKAMFRKENVLGQEAYVAAERIQSEEFWETSICESYVEEIDTESDYDSDLEYKVYMAVNSLISKLKKDKACFCEEFDG